MPKVLPGDIVVRYRPKYDKRWFMFWKYLVQRAICFFTTEYWLGERSSNVSHAELGVKQISDTEFQVFTMEPPHARFKDRKFKRSIIFRLIPKPADFDARFENFVARKYGKKYEYFKLFLFILDWLFRTTWFTRTFNAFSKNVCSENDAEFFQVDVKQPCSAKDFRSTSPDDILDYCKAHPELFELISDIW